MNTGATKVSPSRRLRRSERIRELNVKKEQDLRAMIRATEIDAKSVTIPKATSKLRARSKSVAFASNVAAPKRSKTTLVHRNHSGSLANSNHQLKAGHRARSKSVAFDSNVATPKRSTTTTPRNIFANANSIATNVRCVNSTVPAPVVHRLVVRDASIQCDIRTQSTTLDHHSCEARIDSLVQSNEKKIDRIKSIQAERDLLLGEEDRLLTEIATLHRFNKAMAEEIDQHNLDIARLETEVQAHKERVLRLNGENFDLRAKNDRLTASIKTHSDRVSDEHDYI